MFFSYAASFLKLQDRWGILYPFPGEKTSSVSPAGMHIWRIGRDGSPGGIHPGEIPSPGRRVFPDDLPAEDGGRKTEVFPEHADEIAGILESAFGGDRINGELRLFQQFESVFEPQGGPVFREGLLFSVAQEAGERGGMQSGEIGKILPHERILEIGLQRFFGAGPLQFASGESGVGRFERLPDDGKKSPEVPAARLMIAVGAQDGGQSLSSLRAQRIAGVEKDIRSVLRRRESVVGDVDHPDAGFPEDHGDHPVFPVPEFAGPAGRVSDDRIAGSENSIIVSSSGGEEEVLASGERQKDPCLFMNPDRGFWQRLRFSDPEFFQWDFLCLAEEMNHFCPAGDHRTSPCFGK